MKLDWNPFLILWWPHSGCRWLNRSLLSQHPAIATSEFSLPFLTHTTDMVLALDRTSQVHKARSLPELSEEFDLLRRSVQTGRLAGTVEYLSGKRDMLERALPGGVHGGPVSPGAPEPLAVDVPLLLDAAPKARFIHLIRHPFDCFASMKSRWEMDGNPARIAASWTAINSEFTKVGADLGAGQFYTLRYEDLRADTENRLKELMDWLGLPFDPSVLESDKYYGKNKGLDTSRLITSEEERVIWEIAGSLAGQYGYRNDPEIKVEPFLQADMVRPLISEGI